MRIHLQAASLKSGAWFSRVGHDHGFLDAGAVTSSIKARAEVGGATAGLEALLLDSLL